MQRSAVVACASSLLLSMGALAAQVAPAAEVSTAARTASLPVAARAPDVALRERLLGELGRAQALPDLFRLYEQRDARGDLTFLAATLDAVAAAPKAREDVKALAGELRIQIALAQGQLAQARDLAASLAAVRAWSIIGPFENEGRAGLSAVYGPERDGFVPKKSYAGKEHDVTWRALDAALAPYGFVDLSSAISPRQDVAVYAATLLRSPRAQPAFVHLGASGAARVWLNGKLVHEDTGLHPSRFDQRTFPIELGAGDNAVLVKIAHATGRLGFSFRLTGGKDAPLASIARDAQPLSREAPALASTPGEVKLPAKTPQPRKPPADALAELRDAAAKAPADARAQEDLAILLEYRRPGDEGERLPLHAIERAMEALPGDPALALRYARLEDRDANRRRAALDAALAAHPNQPDLLCALAGYRLERGEGWEAIALAQAAQKADPAQLEPMLVLARAYDSVGLTARSSLLRLEAAEKHPDSARAARAAAQAQRRFGRPALAEQELRRALTLRFDDAEARAELTGLLLDQGKLAPSLQLLGEAVALEPSSLYPRLRAAELLSENGSKDEAEKAYAQVLALSPDEADAHEQLGRHRLRAKDDTGALAAFTRALALRPQNPSLRELVRAVHPEEQYAAPYFYDAPKLASAAPGQGEDAETLADLSVTKVFANGLSSRTRQLVVRALTQRGVDLVRVQAAQYSPDRQVLKVERARIIKKDGSVVESRGERERNLSEPWYGIYYDVREHSVFFSQLQPGDTVELVTRTDDSGSNFFADYFGDFAYLQDTTHKRISDYVLLGPPGRTFYATASPLPRLEHSEGRTEDGGTFQRWTARDVARVVPEPAMPGFSELFAYVHVSTYKDWQSVGRFYWGLVKDQLRVTDDIRAAATLAVKGLPEADERARIGAVYDFVVSRTRYVGLEFGINSFKPYPVETILSRRFGDCKDKASLMHAMLEALGIDSRLALMRTKHKGGIDAAPASLAVFDHAILYVPKYDLFLDGTAEFHGSRELPDGDRGAEALIVDPAGESSRFLRTPEAAPADNVDETHSQIELRPDGSAALRIDASAVGSWTAELRRTFESPDERRLRAEEQLGRSAFPGVKVSAVEVSDPHDIEQPFTTHITAEAPSFASPLQEGLRFSPFGQRASFMEAYASLSSRALPESVGVPRRLLLESKIALPPGWQAALPEDAQQKSPDGSYAITYASAGGQVTARLELVLRGGTLAPKDYPAFRAFLRKLDEALQRKALASPPAQTAANEAGSRGK